MLLPVQNKVKDLQHQLGLTDHLALLDRAWETELGRLASLARIVAVDRSAVVVEVDSSPAMQEITLRRKELVRRLNKHFPEEFVKQITVRMAQRG
jgi:hypothetical protein